MGALPDLSCLATAVTVGITAVPLPATNHLSSRKALEVYNNGTVAIYIGGSAVTASTGIPIAAGEFYSCEIGRARLYAISYSKGKTTQMVSNYSKSR